MNYYEYFKNNFSVMAYEKGKVCINILLNMSKQNGSFWE